MMPKGVEHSTKTAKDAGSADVRIPMMPKGVEHTPLWIGTFAAPDMVRIPMMPKGVEHIGWLKRKSPGPCENSDDAERR